MLLKRYFFAYSNSFLEHFFLIEIKTISKFWFSFKTKNSIEMSEVAQSVGLEVENK